MKTYKIVRFSSSGNRRIIKRGQTLAQAQEHCSNPETSGSTCSNLRRRGHWFHGFEAEAK